MSYKSFSVRWSKSQYEMLRSICDAQGETQSDLLRKLVMKEFLKNEIKEVTGTIVEKVEIGEVKCIEN